jgi:2-polyprenyl-3-methyl-5-hydroxy-6-metoxy-1,4-benzoquinol methylase
VNLLELESPMKIFDLACGFGRHANRLAALGHFVTGIDYTPGFLEIAQKDAREWNVQVDYRLTEMRVGRSTREILQRREEHRRFRTTEEDKIG